MSNNLSNFLGIVGWVVGIISGALQLRSYYEQRKFEKGYLNILEEAKRDWEGRYTEEQVRELIKELARLRKLIEHDVPRHAKRVFLENQLTALSDNLGELYSRYTQLSSELRQQNITNSLSLELELAIKTTIIPNYKVKQRRQQTIICLLIVILAFLVILNFDFLVRLFSLKVTVLMMHYSLGWLLVFGLIILIIIYILSKLSHGRIEKWVTGHSILPKILVGFSWLFSWFLFLAFIVDSDEWFSSYNSELWSIGLIIAVFVATSIAFSILSSCYLMLKLLRKNKKKH